MVRDSLLRVSIGGSRHADIQDILGTEKNRLGAPYIDGAAERSLRDHITYLESELERVVAEIDELIKRHPPHLDTQFLAHKSHS